MRSLAHSNLTKARSNPLALYAPKTFRIDSFTQRTGRSK